LIITSAKCRSIFKIFSRDSERELFTTTSYTYFKIQTTEPTSFSKLKDKYCELNLEFMNLLQNFELAVNSLTNNFCTCLVNFCEHEYTVTLWILLHRPSVYHVYHIIVSDVSLKLDALGYIFCHRKFRCIFNHFYAMRPGRYTQFGEITQNKGLYAVQDHSRSPILVPIDSSYTTSY